MVRSKRLKPIKQLAKNKEKLAAQELGVSIENERQQSQKLEQLHQYRSEYIQEMDVKVKQGVSGDTLQRYHQFLAKLDLAISQQKEAVMQSSQQLNQSQSHWQDKRSRAKAITQVMDKMQVQEQKTQSKKENIQLDEMSTQAFIRQHSK